MTEPKPWFAVRSIAPWIAWACPLISAAAQAGVHRCLHQDGITEYTDQPCAAGSVQLPKSEPSRIVVEQKGKVTNMTVVGQLAANRPLDCVSIDLAGKDHTPPDLYQGVSACIHQEDYRTAVALFALAGMESRFDAQRVLDKTAGQAGQVLIMETLNGLAERSAEDKFFVLWLRRLKASVLKRDSKYCLVAERFRTLQDHSI